MLTEVDYCPLTGDTPAAPVIPPRCEWCDKPATCHGAYEGLAAGFACDECCGHGCEDGFCYPIGQPR